MPREKSDKKTAAMETIHKGIDEVHELLKKAKEKYDMTDDKTKKKIVAGIAGSAALIAGIIGLKKHGKKKDEEK